MRATGALIIFPVPASCLPHKEHCQYVDVSQSSQWASWGSGVAGCVGRDLFGRFLLVFMRLLYIAVQVCRLRPCPKPSSSVFTSSQKLVLSLNSCFTLLLSPPLSASCLRSTVSLLFYSLGSLSENIGPVETERSVHCMNYSSLENDLIKSFRIMAAMNSVRAHALHYRC